jgi:hypothetical protein
MYLRSCPSRPPGECTCLRPRPSCGWSPDKSPWAHQHRVVFRNSLIPLMLVSPSTDAVSIWLDGSCERRVRTSASLCWLSSLVGPKDKDSIVRLAGFDSLMAHLTNFELSVILATFRSQRRVAFLGHCARFVGLCLSSGCMATRTFDELSPPKPPLSPSFWSGGRVGGLPIETRKVEPPLPTVILDK